MNDHLRDVRLAVRFLLRNRGFALAAIVILGLGISLTTTLYAIVRGALIEPWPYHGYDRLVTVRRDLPSQGRRDFSLWSAPEIDDLRRETRIFEHVIAGDARNVNAMFNGHAERVRAAIISPNVFRALGVAAMLGRSLDDADAAADATPAVVVNYRFWRNRLGADLAVVGKTLRLADGAYTIVGVMPERFVFWDRDLWMPLRLNANAARADRRFYVQAMLRTGVTLSAASAALRRVSLQWTLDHPEQIEYAGSAIVLGFLVEDVLRDLRPTLYLLLGCVGLVLMVATANLANAMLAKGLARESELAIRRAIGGSGLQICRQLLVESAVIGIAGGLLGAAAGSFLLPEILDLIPFGYVPAEAHILIDWRVVAAVTLCAAGCGVLVGVVPAIRAARVDPAILLRVGDSRTGSGRRHWWQSAFVIAQLAFAVVVVGIGIAATVNVRSAVSRHPGFDSSDIWTARIAVNSAGGTATSAAAVYDAILARLAADPRVGAAAMATLFPVGDQATMLVSPAGSAGARRLATREAAAVSVSPAFFSLLKISAVEGRLFTADDRDAHPAVAVVTRLLARRLWPDGQSVGRPIFIGENGDDAATVVGVVGDLRNDAPGEIDRASIFFPLAQRAPSAVMVGLKMADGSSGLSVLADATHRVDPAIPVYDPSTLQQQRVAVLGPKLLAVALLAVFAATAIALSAAGIYAIVSQSVQERSRELRIRLAFGAEPGRLFRGELARTGRLVAVAAAIGGSIAIATMRMLASTFAVLAATTPALFVSVGVIMIVAFLATLWPAWRACHPTALN